MVSEQLMDLMTVLLVSTVITAHSASHSGHGGHTGKQDFSNTIYLRVTHISLKIDLLSYNNKKLRTS